MGDSSLGFITVSYYDWTHASDLNKDFVKAYREANNGRNPDVLSIGAWDGMRVIYDALKKTKGDSDGEKLIEAVKGLSWESPRGQVTISPTTRDIVETYYIRRVEKIDGVLQNVEFDKIEPSGVVKK
jgi:branched-chain amino acid transport system substrate-binding protein